jgi:hypothetical protein
MKFKLAKSVTPIKDHTGTVSYYWHILKGDVLSGFSGEGSTSDAARQDALNKIKEIKASGNHKENK